MINSSIKVKSIINTIEAHNAGMPIRIVMLPSIPGKSMIDKLRFCRKELDWLRRMLMFEPRGSRNSYGILVTSPASESADFGALFMDPTGWHSMCGHASMGFASVAVQLGLVKVREPITSITLDTPAGLVKLDVEVVNGSVRRVSLTNVPSFILKEVKVSVKGYGRIKAYISFGGNFYAVVRLEDLGIKWGMNALGRLIEVARSVWRELKSEELLNPLTGVKGELYGVRFAETITERPRREYGILIFGSPDNPLVDRSPSGTGSSAHLAYLRYLGEVGVNEEVRFVSPVNTEFAGEVVGEGIDKGVKYVVPRISTIDKGGYVTGYATWVIDGDDPLREGFEPLKY